MTDEINVFCFRRNTVRDETDVMSSRIITLTENSTATTSRLRQVGRAWVSLSLIGCRYTGKGVFQRNPQS